MDKLIQELSELGTILTIKDGYVFTLHMVGKDISKNMFKIMGLVTQESAISGKPVVEVCNSHDDYCLIVLRPLTVN